MTISPIYFSAWLVLDTLAVFTNTGSSAMRSILPRGTYVPLVTPFTEQGDIDFDSLDRLIDRLLNANVEAFVVLGTTGESPTVNADEATALIKHTITRAGGSASVIAGVGGNNTQASVVEAKAVMDLGVDGLLVVCPYYSRPTQQGLYDHFRIIAEEAPIPQLVYNIAGRTGVNIETNTLVKLSELPNVVGVKESGDNIDQISELLQELDNDFLVLSGCDHLNFPLLCLGGAGVVSTIANLVPEKVKAMVDAVFDNDIENARQLHFSLAQLVAGCSVETNPIPIKTALAMTGEIKEIFRSPLCKMAPMNRIDWTAILKQQGLLSSDNTMPRMSESV